MKKLFTLVCALMAFGGVANAATVDEIEQLKHSYVLVCDDLGARPGKGVLFGANHFLDVTGGSTATNKGSVDLSVADGVLVTEEIAAKYGAEYAGPHLNFLRLKNDQDVIAMKVTAKTKVIIFYNNNGADRYPMFGTDAKPTTNPMANQGTKSETVNKIARIEWTAEDDGLVYIGGKGGDQFLSYIIVEANEAPGTPTIKLGDQTYQDGLWFREVTAKANDYKMEGSDDAIPTIITYTTDGSTPNASSPVYTEPIKCYKDMTVKFQAYQDWGMGADEGFICGGADNEANVSFSFNAPAINADGANVTITSEYEGAKNFVTLDGNLESAEETSEFTLDESATVTAFSKIVNGEYATFQTKSVSQDVYVLNPIKEKKTIAVTAGEVVVDEEATKEAKEKDASAADVLVVKDGAISADKMDFFVKDLDFGIVQKNDTANYQVPDGQEVYIKMSTTNITFFVAEGDSVDVKVICAKNACKNINAADAADGAQVNDRKCLVNVDGVNYGNGGIDDGKTVFADADLKLFPEANVIKFGLKAGIHTFQKYSGTGNILISSIEITPATKQEALLGDVNGDGKVDVEDVVGIVNKILGEPAEGFIEANADVNGDSKIDVDDVVAAVNIILGDTNE